MKNKDIITGVEILTIEEGMFKVEGVIDLIILRVNLLTGKVHSITEVTLYAAVMMVDVATMVGVAMIVGATMMVDDKEVNLTLMGVVGTSGVVVDVAEEEIGIWEN
eukprot:gene45653-61023_t